MKKKILTVALVIGAFCFANAQTEGNAIGLRLGYGVEASFQHALGDANRLEIDLGTSFGSHNDYGAGSNSFRLGLSGIYQWVFDLSALAPGFNWYVGPGVTLGLESWSVNVLGNKTSGSDFNFGICGQVGIEYNFANVPLHLSLDYRPTIYFVPDVYGGYGDVALSIRYKF